MKIQQKKLRITFLGQGHNDNFRNDDNDHFGIFVDVSILFFLSCLMFFFSSFQYNDLMYFYFF